MATATPHQPCRWHSRAGEYLVGGTPTVADPRQTGVLDTALINAHEQHHRDLINNTVYGYVLRRLRELDTAPPSIESRRNRLVTSLAAKIWTCAEGSATAMESLMAVTPGSGTTLAALEASLTPDYSEALAIFQPIREYAIPFPPPFDMLARACLLNAAVECAVDSFIFHEPNLPEEFWALADQIDNAAVPDELIAPLVSAAAQLPSDALALLFNQNKPLLSSGPNGIIAFSRMVTLGLKFSLLVQEGLNPLPALLEDAARVEYIAFIDKALTEAFPALPHIEWRPGHISGSQVQVQTQEPEFLLQEEEVAATALLDRMFSLASAPGFQLFVVLFQRELPGSTYTVVAHPMANTPQGLDMAVPYLISRNVAPQILKIVDACPIRLVWETTILHGGGKVFYDPELVNLLARPTFLELREFSWPGAMQIAAAFSGPPSLVSYKLPAELSLSVASIRKGNRIVFGLAPLKFLPDFEIAEKASEVDLGTDIEVAAVTVVLVRQSRTTRLLPAE